MSVANTDDNTHRCNQRVPGPQKDGRNVRVEYRFPKVCLMQVQERELGCWSRQTSRCWDMWGNVYSTGNRPSLWQQGLPAATAQGTNHNVRRSRSWHFHLDLNRQNHQDQSRNGWNFTGLYRCVFFSISHGKEDGVFKIRALRTSENELAYWKSTYASRSHSCGQETRWWRVSLNCFRLRVSVFPSVFWSQHGRKTQNFYLIRHRPSSPLHTQWRF